MSWAAYPLVESEPLQDSPVDNGRAAYLVRFRDLRYGYPGNLAHGSLGARVFLTHDLKPVDERIGSRSANSSAR